MRPHLTGNTGLSDTTSGTFLGHVKWKCEHETTNEVALYPRTVVCLCRPSSGRTISQWHSEDGKEDVGCPRYQQSRGRGHGAVAALQKPGAGGVRSCTLAKMLCSRSPRVAGSFSRPGIPGPGGLTPLHLGGALSHFPGLLSRGSARFQIRSLSVLPVLSLWCLSAPCSGISLWCSDLADTPQFTLWGPFRRLLFQILGIFPIIFKKKFVFPPPCFLSLWNY